MILYVAGARLVQYWQLTDQLYHDEIDDMETVEDLLYFTPDGRIQLNESYHSHPESKLRIDRLMEVLDPDARCSFETSNSKAPHWAVL